MTDPTYTRTLCPTEYWAWINHPGVRTDLTADTAMKARSWAHDRDVEEDVTVIVCAPYGTPIEAWPLRYRGRCEHDRAWRCGKCEKWSPNAYGREEGT